MKFRVKLERVEKAWVDVESENPQQALKDAISKHRDEPETIEWWVGESYAKDIE